MDTIAEIRRRHLVSKESISSIARDLNLSRQTIRKHLRTTSEPVYKRSHQPMPKLGLFQSKLEEWLTKEQKLPKKQRRTARRLFECLQTEGYQGAYDSIQRFVRHWQQEQPRVMAKQAFIPLAFSPGEACQFDWSHEQVELGGVIQTIKVAHFRLCYSRQTFVVGYLRETLEMVLDAHNQAFTFFGGVPKRMIYDNLKTVVDTIFIGKDRQFNRRFMALANHYLFEPVACTPAAGWEKGQVENQVGNIREWLFTPRPRFANLAELNTWLTQRCREIAQRAHPTEKEHSIADCFIQESKQLRVITTPFDGYVEHLLRVSSTCLVRVDHNRYSVPAHLVGKIVSVKLTAQRISIVSEGEMIADHARSLGKNHLICDPWHYLPILEKKPGALRNGIPFQQWELPLAIKTVRDRILKQPKGDRAFVELLLLARQTSLEALTVACELTLETGHITAAIVINELRRLTAPTRLAELTLPNPPSLHIPPTADYRRYDNLRQGIR
jgi:transposase